MSNSLFKITNKYYKRIYNVSWRYNKNIKSDNIFYFYLDEAHEKIAELKKQVDINSIKISTFEIPMELLEETNML